MNYKAIIFDKDGTLLDFDAFWLAVSDGALDDIIRKTKSTASKEELLSAMDVHDGICDIRGILASGTYADMGRAIFSVLAKHGADMSESEITELTIKAYHDNYGKGTVAPTCENQKSHLMRLKEMGLKLAVITTDDAFVTKKCLDALGIAECFDEILADDGKSPTKPDPYYMNLVCKKWGTLPSEVLMVGDTITDMRFAKNSGACALGVGKSPENRAVLAEYTDKVFPDISYVTEVL